MVSKAMILFMAGLLSNVAAWASDLALVSDNITTGGAVEISGLIPNSAVTNYKDLSISINKRFIPGWQYSKIIHISGENDAKGVYISLWLDPVTLEPLFKEGGHYDIEIFTEKLGGKRTTHFSCRVTVSGEKITDRFPRDAAAVAFLMSGTLSDRAIGDAVLNEVSQRVSDLLVVHNKLIAVNELSSDSNKNDDKLRVAYDELVQSYRKCEGFLGAAGELRYHVRCLAARLALVQGEPEQAKFFLQDIPYDAVFPLRDTFKKLRNAIGERGP